MNIPIILGTARGNRESEKAAQYMLEKVKAYSLESGAILETELLDVRDFDLLGTDNTEKTAQAKKWSEIMKRADGLIIVAPEYNHGYPGELKIMLDELYSEYAHKPMGICGVSKGPLGGSRMIEQLRLVAIELHMVPIRNALYFPNIQKFFGENGATLDPALPEKFKKFMDELLWYAKALKAARE